MGLAEFRVKQWCSQQHINKNIKERQHWRKSRESCFSSQGQKITHRLPDGQCDQRGGVGPSLPQGLLKDKPRCHMPPPLPPPPPQSWDAKTWLQRLLHPLLGYKNSVSFLLLWERINLVVLNQGWLCAPGENMSYFSKSESLPFIFQSMEAHLV